MNMIDIKHFTRTPVERAAKLNIGDSIKLLTYKRDRKVVITKVDTNSYKVTESGFEDKEFQSVTINELSKLLSELQLIEFPRSKKFYMIIIPASNK